MEFPITPLKPDVYPPALREIPQVPKVLYSRGAVMDTTRRMVAVVGARYHSDYGRKACEKLVMDLARYPVTIVSGLAIGIDAVAHEAALRAGLPTVAVVGSGLDDSVLYPASNQSLARRILESGGTLLSELAAKERATRYTFPARNRIMAGLSEVVVAVECEVKSGTRITTRLAAEYNKEVGAVPHSIFSEVGAGANALIQQGAHIIRGGADIAELLGMEVVSTATSAVGTLTDTERKVYDALRVPKTKTVLLRETGLPAHVAQATLISLEMKGLVVEMLGMVQRKAG